MCILRYNDQKKNIKQAKKGYYAQKTVLLKICIVKSLDLMKEIASVRKSVALGGLESMKSTLKMKLETNHSSCKALELHFQD